MRITSPGLGGFEAKSAGSSPLVILGSGFITGGFKGGFKNPSNPSLSLFFIEAYPNYAFFYTTKTKKNKKSGYASMLFYPYSEYLYVAFLNRMKLIEKADGKGGTISTIRPQSASPTTTLRPALLALGLSHTHASSLCGPPVSGIQNSLCYRC